MKKEFKNKHYFHQIWHLTSEFGHIFCQWSKYFLCMALNLIKENICTV